MCRFCGGKGCIACPAESEKEREKAFEPIFVARRGNAHDMKLLKQFLGKEALDEAFAPKTGDLLDDWHRGAQAVERNAAVASLVQLLHDEREGTTQ